MELLSSSYFALFLIISIGFIIGKISIKNISLDISAVIFVALIFGHFGVVIPKDFQRMGLVLFLFTIGIQAGPGFFSSFKEKGKSLIILAFVLVFSGGLTAALLAILLDIDINIVSGLFTGALTSTPGLAAAIDITGSPLASIGYGIAYPFGVIGVILFVRMLPKIMKLSIKDAENTFERSQKVSNPEFFKKNFIVENEKVVGKSLSELKIRTMTKAVISRVLHQDGLAITPTKDTILQKGDVVKAVGPESAMSKMEYIIGPETKKQIPLNKRYDVRPVLVTKSEVINKTIGELNILNTYSANITRIRRSGIDLAPTPNTKLLLGDKVVIAASVDNIKQVSEAFGDDSKRLSDTDFLPIAIGIVLGVLVGKVSLVAGNMSFSLGLSGGVLLTSLILGRVGKTGPILWTMTGAANNLLRQFGLLLFLASVGTSAGGQIVSTFQQYGFELFLVGGAITLIPMILGVFVGKRILKIDVLTMLGGLTGSMTSTPGLAAIDSMTESEAPSIAYATVYPAAMVFVIIVVQLLGLIA
ncbi:transporter [Halosquirtibacter xylanolyticus]|uniref:aspartate:alanine exchanger family transporter n=1 Tax=Halosquirtibacter xylanolyticus TaxID=3374599 RepID=UPI003748E145|nr:transporter [Prolixibacteraceae bacterium]